MLQVKQLNFSYEEKEILKDINFQLSAGSVLALIGESGCGKSTLLKLVYGLLDANSGSLSWKHQKISGPSDYLVPGMSFAKYLAQDFDLMPFTTVSENIGTYLSNFEKEYKNIRIQELLEVVEMADFAHVKVKNLSGGQMQRVALAKVLAKEPELLLLDEPFSHIDNFRKNNLRRKVFQYLASKNITCIIATHDIDDILSFSKETIVLKKGLMVSEDKTTSTYQNPNSFYVASLFDEVSNIDEKLYYPHQLVICEEGKLQVKVCNNYYKGSYYLIEAISENYGKVFFNSEYSLQINEKINLKIKTD